jgi:hypothetical protein
MSEATIKQGKYFPWHPYLLAIFPTLALLANNLPEIEMAEAFRPFLVSLAGAILLTLVLKLFVKDWHKAAGISSLALALFFSYGHIYNILESHSLAGISIGRHRILAPIYLVIFVAGVWWITRPDRRLGILTQTLNIMVIAAVALPVLQISAYFLQEERDVGTGPSNSPQDLRLTGEKPPPDIYYIILDAYSRDDVLKDFYNFDNSPFLNDLANLGFYVASCSQSNYAQTQLSLASALNMDTISKLSSRFTPENTSRVGMPGLIKHSTVRGLLERLGHKMVAFETGYYWTQVEDADVYLSPKSSTASLLDVTGGFSAFESLLIKTTGLLIVLDGASVLPQWMQIDIDNPDRIHRERVLFTLDQLGRLPAMQGPKFIFAHIVSPHKPLVFGPQGEIVEQKVDDITGYRDQVAYLNSRLIPLLWEIISNSSAPPVIILQGDHGGLDTSEEERMAILNAYYLPEGGNRLLYENISPVNTFRLVFNHYFGGRYDLLEDVSYFSAYKYPYQYTVIPDTRSGCP